MPGQQAMIPWATTSSHSLPPWPPLSSSASPLGRGRSACATPWIRLRLCRGTPRRPGAARSRYPGTVGVATCSLEPLRRGPGPRRDAVDVGHHVHDRRLARGYSLVEGALNLAGMVHTNTKAAHVLGQLGKISVRKHPQLLHIPRLAPVVA